MKPIKVIFLLLLFVWSANIFAQGEDCASAIKINSIPYNTPALISESTCTAGDNYTSTDRCGNKFMDGPDFMFEYTPTNNVCVNLLADPAVGEYDPIALFVTEGCPDDVNGKCIAQFTNPNNTGNTAKPASISDLSLSAGKTYYFQVSSMTNCIDFTFHLSSSTNCSADPVGYNCETAQTISTLPFDTISATNCNRNSYIKEGNYCYTQDFNDQPSYIYKFISPISGCVKITGRTSDATMRFSKHNACPTYSDTTCKRTMYFYQNTVREYIEYVKAGKVYYYAISSDTRCSSYNLKFEAIPDSGATCSNAYEIIPNTNGYYEQRYLTTRCMSDDVKQEGHCMPSSYWDDGNEMFIKYYSNGNECISASAFNVHDGSVPNERLKLSLFKDCPSPSNNTIYAEDCATNFDNYFQADISYNITDPGWYFFVLSGYSQANNQGETTYSDRFFDFRFNTASLSNLGTDCSNPDVLPSTTYNYKANISVQCKGDDYDPSMACGSSLIEGEDYVFEYTAPQDFCGTVTAKNVKGTGGILMFDACPNTSPNCLGKTGCINHCDSIYFDYDFEAGKKYYIIGSSATGSNFIFDLEIKKRYNTPDGCIQYPSDCPKACDDCLNADFEVGSFDDWTASYGTYGDPEQNSGFHSTYTNAPFTRHTLINSNGYDPVVGDANLKLQSPIEDRYVIRLGNREGFKDAERITYKFNITSKTKNFFFYHAVVLNDLLHHPTNQPFFEVKTSIKDKNGTISVIPCASFRLATGQDVNHFTTTYDHTAISNPGTINWRDWTLVATNLEDYIGQELTVEFTTKDCDLGGHFGYAYLDAFCGSMELITDNNPACIGDSIKITAPKGFTSYSWNTGETTRSIYAKQSGTYSVNLTSFHPTPGMGCPLSLKTTVNFNDNPEANFTYDEGCDDQFIDFYDHSNGSPSYPVNFWSWNFDDGTGEYQSANRNHAFPGPGTYDVRLAVENTGGCKDTITKEIVIPDYPSLGDPNAIDTIVVCEGDSARLFAKNLGNVSYLWSGPGFSSTEQNPLINPVEIENHGKFVVEIVSLNDPCLKAYDTTFIDVVPLPLYTIKDDTEKCFQDRSLKLFATGGEDEFSYSWTPADIFDNPLAQNPVATPDSTVEISVSTTHTYCPDSTMSMILTIDYYQEMLELVDSIDVCTGDSIIIRPLAGDPLEYLVWNTPDGYISDGEEIIHPKASDSLGGWYVVTAFLGDGPYYCEYAYDSVYVNVIPAPNANIDPLSARNCVGEMVDFTALTPKDNMIWTNTDGDTVGAGASVSVLVNDEYYYVTYNDQTGCTNKDSVFAEVITLPKPNIGDNKSLCAGNSYEISLINESEFSGDYSFSWNTGASGTSIVVSITGEYILTAEAQGCTISDTVNIFFQNPEDFSIGKDTTLCSNQEFSFDFTGQGESIVWNDGNTNFQRNIGYPGGEFWVNIQSGSCELKDTISIQFEDLVPTLLPNDTTICHGDSIRLDGNPVGANYAWYQNGNLISSANHVYIKETGINEVILKSSTSVCTDADTIIIEVLSKNPLTILDKTICESDSIWMDISQEISAQSYDWGDGFKGAARWISSAKTYTLEVAVSNCTVRDTFEIFHDALPKFSLGPDQRICEGNQITLSPDNSSWNNYQWENGPNTASLTVDTAGTFILSASQASCVYSDTIMVSMDTIPNFNLGPDFTICENEDTVLSTGINNPAITHLWSTGATSNNIRVSTAGNYSVTITNGACTFTDDVNLGIQTLPGVDLGPDIKACAGETVRIGFNTNNATYIWNTGATTDSINVNQSGTYILTVNQGVCEESDKIYVEFEILKAPNLGEDLVQCDVIDAFLDANTVAHNYKWYLDGNLIPGENNRSLNISQAGAYSVAASNGNCELWDEINVAVQKSPDLSLSKDSVLCEGESYLISATTNANDPTFLWNTNESSQEISVNTSGVYSVTVIDGVCAVSQSANIVFVPHPFLDLPAGSTICENDAVTIGDFFEKDQLDTNKVDYSWNNGADTAIITVNLAGNYVETARIEHCFDVANYNLNVVPMPVPQMSAPLVTCANDLKTITTGLPGLTTTWNLGAGTGHSIIPRQSGEYVATITDGPCTVRDTVWVTINPTPDEYLGDFYVCPKDSLQLFVTTENATAIWNGVETNPITVAPMEKYSLEIINQFGCREVQTVNIFEDPNCFDDLYIPNVFTPNNDGVNETFKVSMSEKITFQSFEVFNRWGKKVYQCEGEYIEWDGIFEGNEVLPGVYVYNFKYIDQYELLRTKTGNITIIK